MCTNTLLGNSTAIIENSNIEAMLEYLSAANCHSVVFSASHCPVHKWKSRAEVFHPEKKSIFALPEAQLVSRSDAAEEEEDESAGEEEVEEEEEEGSNTESSSGGDGTTQHASKANNPVAVGDDLNKDPDDPDDLIAVRDDLNKDPDDPIAVGDDLSKDPDDLGTERDDFTAHDDPIAMGDDLNKDPDDTSIEVSAAEDTTEEQETEKNDPETADDSDSQETFSLPRQGGNDKTWVWLLLWSLEGCQSSGSIS